MKNWLKHNWLNVMAALVLLGASGRWPYGYYQMLRWVACVAAAYAAYAAYRAKKAFWQWLMVTVAILFNPIAPFYLKRETWQAFDVLAALIFITVMFFNFSQSATIQSKKI